MSTNPWGVTFDDWGQHMASYPIYAQAFHALDPAYPDQHPRPVGLHAYSGTCGQEFVDFPTGRRRCRADSSRYATSRLTVSSSIAGTSPTLASPRSTSATSFFQKPQLHSGRSALRTRRSDVRLRLVQPGQGPRPVLAARRTPRSGQRPYFPHHAQGGQAAADAADSRCAAWPTARHPEAPRVPLPLLGQARVAGPRPGQDQGSPRRLGGQLDPTDPRHRHHQIEAIWLYRGIGAVNTKLLAELLECDNHHARAAAAHQFRYWHAHFKNEEQILDRLAGDPSTLVRMETAIATSYIGTPGHSRRW